MSFFSIIVPTFNAENTISDCLFSILKQSFIDFEIIIQDGCSTDNTLKLITEINDKRIKLSSEKDQGVYDAMNKAVLRCNGEWFYFLGSDDTLYSEDVLENISIELKKTCASVVYGDVKLTGEGGVIKGNDMGLYRGYTSTEELIFDNICHQAIFYKSRIFKNDNRRYELKYNVQADHIFNIKLASKYDFQYVSIIVSNFQHGGISTKVVDSFFSKDIGSILLRYYGFQLSNIRFLKSKSYIRNEAKKLLKEQNYFLATKAYFIYFGLKINYFFKK